MKQILNWMLAAILVGGIMVLASCSNSDNSIPPDTTALTAWQAGKTVSAEAVAAYGGIDNCFAAEPIPDGVWQRMQGKTYKENPYIGRDDLRHVRALHWDYDDQMHIGEMVCNKQIADRLVRILRQLFDAKYPIQRMLLPDVYDADDETQMRDNNSSCFCYRNIAATNNLSKHARGLAVDINTLYNPYIKTLDDGTLLIQPATAEAYCNRDWDFPYKIDHDDLCFRLFTEAGFDWGGDWDNRKDYQHFELIEPQPSDTWDAETGTLTVNSNPGKNAYKGRTDIVSVVFSDAVTSIGDGAFYDCRFGVIDIPASVRSIGSEAFAAEDSELQTVTIYAKACSFDNHPFPQSIMTDIYVPAESEDSYKDQNPYYARQIKAIPEAQQTDNVIVWSRALCRYIWVMLPYNHEGEIAAAHNTQGGITVTFTGAVNEGGFNMWYISLLQSEKLTFTSTVGNISQITIQAEPYEEDEEPDIPVAEGWTWDAAKRTFTWQGTPSATVEMLASEEIELENVQIQFTID